MVSDSRARACVRIHIDGKPTRRRACPVASCADPDSLRVASFLLRGWSFGSRLGRRLVLVVSRHSEGKGGRHRSRVKRNPRVGDQDAAWPSVDDRSRFRKLLGYDGRGLLLRIYPLLFPIVVSYLSRKGARIQRERSSAV